MPRFRSLVAIALLSLPAMAAAPPMHVVEAIDVPVANRPSHFYSGAIGESFQIKMTAPSELPPERPFTLTVRVAAAGRWWQRPRRPELKEVPSFAHRFEISLPAPRERAPSGGKKQRPAPAWREEPDREPGAGIWEFDYLLKLKPGAPNRVPPLPMAYYTPRPDRNLPGYFPTAFGEGFPLTVQPSTALEPPTPIEVPEYFQTVQEGPAVLEPLRWPLPSIPWLAGLFLVPPVTSGVGFLAWRYLSPDAAQLARKRQSRAARIALHALDTVGNGGAPRVAAVMNHFLRNRVGLPKKVETPGEVAMYLQRLGGPPDLAGKTAELFRACDAARYGPPEARGRDDLAIVARQLVLALEAEPWPSRM
jgi:hypothetical protein